MINMRNIVHPSSLINSLKSNSKINSKNKRELAKYLIFLQPVYDHNRKLILMKLQSSGDEFRQYYVYKRNLVEAFLNEHSNKITSNPLFENRNTFLVKINDDTYLMKLPHFHNERVLNFIEAYRRKFRTFITNKILKSPSRLPQLQNISYRALTQNNRNQLKQVFPNVLFEPQQRELAEYKKKLNNLSEILRLAGFKKPKTVARDIIKTGSSIDDYNSWTGKRK